MDPAQLYALPPEEFTAARDAAAKGAKTEGDAAQAKELKALRRPSVAAWLVNRLAREQRELLEQLLALGPALAQAQSSGHADDLRTLGRQRRELVEEVAGAAVSAADRSVGGPVRDEVISTLEAALADPSSADAVRSGRLVRALSYAGFGEVDLSGAVAPGAVSPAPSTTRPAAGKADAAAARAREALAAAEQAAHDAAGDLDDAVREAERAGRRAAQASEVLEAAQQEVQRAEQALVLSTKSRDAAATAAEATARAAETAGEAIRTAQDAAEQARKQLDTLRRT